MYSNISANKRKTAIMFGLFFGVVAGLSWLFGRTSGEPNITFAVIAGGIIYAMVMYFASAKIALAINGAKPISKKDNPRLYRIVENLAITEGLPMPKVYIMEDPAPNAFATGRNPDKAVVCATTGLLEIMDDQELEGVMAHELGHVKNFDIRVSMAAFALVAVIGLLADMLLRWRWLSDDDDSSASQYLLILSIIAALLAPLVATLIQLAISRKREFLADATGALTTRYPEGLARALEKIGKHGSTLRRQNTSTAHLFIANPISGRSLAKLFSTHPPIEDRVRILREIGAKE